MTETTAPPRVRTRRSSLRRVFIVVLSLVMIVLVARAGMDLWAGHRIRVVTATLEQRHGSLDASTLAVAPVPAAENRARAMRAAATFMVGQHQVAAKMSPFLRQPGPLAVPPDLRAFVEANRAALRVADEARARRLANWEADYARATNLPALLEIRTLSNAIYLAARIELDENRADAAATQLATGLSLSSSLRQEPAIIAQLIRCALGLLQFEGVQRLVTQFEPSKASLEELARWLAEERTPEPAHIGLLGELRLVSTALAQGDNGLGEGLLGNAGSGGNASTWARRAIGFGKPMIRLAFAGTMEQIGHLLEIQTGPRPRPALPEVPQTWSPLKRLENMVIPGLARTMDSSDQFSSARGLTELAVALRRYRLDRGQYPDTLAALVPVYLPSVPIDPLTGAAPVYAREGAGFRLKAKKDATMSGAMAATLDWSVPK
jgi:hypothetical protein